MSQGNNGDLDAIEKASTPTGGFNLNPSPIVLTPEPQPLPRAGEMVVPDFAPVDQVFQQQSVSAVFAEQERQALLERIQYMQKQVDNTNIGFNAGQYTGPGPAIVTPDRIQDSYFGNSGDDPDFRNILNSPSEYEISSIPPEQFQFLTSGSNIDERAATMFSDSTFLRGLAEQIHNRYEGDFDEALVAKEQRYAIDNLIYEDLRKAQVVPEVNEDLSTRFDGELKDVLQSNQYVYGTSKEKKALLLNYISSPRRTEAGYSPRGFIEEMIDSRMVYPRLDLLIAKSTAANTLSVIDSFNSKSKPARLAEVNKAFDKEYSLADFDGVEFYFPVTIGEVPNLGSEGTWVNLPEGMTQEEANAMLGSPDEIYLARKIADKLLDIDIEKESSVLSSLGTGLKHGWLKALPILSTFLAIDEQRKINAVIEKQAAGRKLLPEERILAEVIGLRNFITEVGDQRLGYTAGNMLLPEAANFMIELGMTGGVSTAAKASVRRTLSSVGIKGTGRWSAKAVTGLTSLTSIAAQTGLVRTDDAYVDMLRHLAPSNQFFFDGKHSQFIGEIDSAAGGNGLQLFFESWLVQALEVSTERLSDKIDVGKLAKKFFGGVDDFTKPERAMIAAAMNVDNAAVGKLRGYFSNAGSSDFLKRLFYSDLANSNRAFVPEAGRWDRRRVVTGINSVGNSLDAAIKGGSISYNPMLEYMEEFVAGRLEPLIRADYKFGIENGTPVLKIDGYQDRFFQDPIATMREEFIMTMWAVGPITGASAIINTPNRLASILHGQTTAEELRSVKLSNQAITLSTKEEFEASKKDIEADIIEGVTQTKHKVALYQMLSKREQYEAGKLGEFATFEAYMKAEMADKQDVAKAIRQLHEKAETSIDVKSMRTKEGANLIGMMETMYDKYKKQKVTSSFVGYYRNATNRLASYQIQLADVVDKPSRSINFEAIESEINDLPLTANQRTEFDSLIALAKEAKAKFREEYFIDPKSKRLDRNLKLGDNVRLIEYDDALVAEVDNASGVPETHSVRFFNALSQYLPDIPIESLNYLSESIVKLDGFSKKEAGQLIASEISRRVDELNYINVANKAEIITLADALDRLIEDGHVPKSASTDFLDKLDGIVLNSLQHDVSKKQQNRVQKVLYNLAPYSNIISFEAIQSKVAKLQPSVDPKAEKSEQGTVTVTSVSPFKAIAERIRKVSFKGSATYAELKKNNPGVSQLSKGLEKLRNAGKLGDANYSRRARLLISSSVAVIPEAFLDFKIKFNPNSDKSLYDPVKNEIEIGYRGKSPEQLVFNIVEEIAHSAHRNIAMKLLDIRPDNTNFEADVYNAMRLSEDEIKKIAGQSRSSLITTIAKFWKSKRFDSSEYYRVSAEIQAGVKVPDSARAMVEQINADFDQLTRLPQDVQMQVSHGNGITLGQFLGNYERYKFFTSGNTAYSPHHAYYYASDFAEFFARNLADVMLGSTDSYGISPNSGYSNVIQKIKSFILKATIAPILSKFIRSSATPNETIDDAANFVSEFLNREIAPEDRDAVLDIYNAVSQEKEDSESPVVGFSRGEDGTIRFGPLGSADNMNQVALENAMAAIGIGRDKSGKLEFTNHDVFSLLFASDRADGPASFEKLEPLLYDRFSNIRELQMLPANNQEKLDRFAAELIKLDDELESLSSVDVVTQSILFSSDIFLDAIESVGLSDSEITDLMFTISVVRNWASVERSEVFEGMLEEGTTVIGTLEDPEVELSKRKEALRASYFGKISRQIAELEPEALFTTEKDNGYTTNFYEAEAFDGDYQLIVSSAHDATGLRAMGTASPGKTENEVDVTMLVADEGFGVRGFATLKKQFKRRYPGVDRGVATRTSGVRSEGYTTAVPISFPLQSADNIDFEGITAHTGIIFRGTVVQASAHSFATSGFLMTTEGETPVGVHIARGAYLRPANGFSMTPVTYYGAGYNKTGTGVYVTHNDSPIFFEETDTQYYKPDGYLDNLVGDAVAPPLGTVQDSKNIIDDLNLGHSDVFVASPMSEPSLYALARSGEVALTEQQDGLPADMVKQALLDRGYRAIAIPFDGGSLLQLYKLDEKTSQFGSAENIEMPDESPQAKGTADNFDVKSWARLLNASKGNEVTGTDVLVALAQVAQLKLPDGGQEMRNILNMWKKYYIKKNSGKFSIFSKKDLNTILAERRVTDVLSVHQDEVELLEKIVNDSKFRVELAKTPALRVLASKSAAKELRADPKFYIAKRRLAKVNPKVLDKTTAAVEKFNAALQASPDAVNVDEYVDYINGLYSKWLDSKRSAGGQVSEEDAQTKESASTERLERLHDFSEFMSSYLNDTYGDRVDIEEYANHDVSELSERELRTYMGGLRYALRNGRLNHKHLKFSMKLKTNAFMDEYLEQTEQTAIDWFNKKTARSRMFDGYLDAKTGNIKRYSLREHLAFLEGMTNDYSGVLNTELYLPMEHANEELRRQMREILKEIRPPSELGFADEQNVIGIVGLLTQNPEIHLSVEMIDKVVELNITGPWRVGMKITHDTTDPIELQAYTEISRQMKRDLADSIIVSFLEIPDGFEVDRKDFIAKLKREIFASAKRTPSKISYERKKILAKTGASSIAEFVEQVLDRGDRVLNRKQRAYLKNGRNVMKKLADGEYTNGVSLQHVSEVYSGEPFVMIDNYVPIHRYNEFFNIHDQSLFEQAPEKVGSFNSSNENRTSWQIHNDININNSFVKERRDVVMALNTNLYSMIRSRADQQLFYLMNQKHNVMLHQAFNHRFFKPKDDADRLNTQSRTLIRQQFAIIMNRGKRQSVIELRKHKGMQEISRLVDATKIWQVGSFLKAGAQTASSILAMQNMHGNLATRLKDLTYGWVTVFGAKAGGLIGRTGKAEQIDEMLRELMPDVYYRGVADFDLDRTPSEVIAEMGSLKGAVQGTLGSFVFRNRNYRADTSLGQQLQLTPMMIADRLAAKVSAIALYKNYADRRGIDVNFQFPDAELARRAQDSVNETQATDNPLHRLATLNNIRMNPNDRTELQFPGPLGELWNRSNWAFKSFAMFEQKRLLKARAEIIDGILENDLGKAHDGALAYLISAISKMAFQYMKLYGSTYAYAYIIGLVNGDDEEDIVGYRDDLVLNMTRGGMEWMGLNPLLQQLVAFSGRQLAKSYLDVNKLPDEVGMSFNVGEYDVLGYIGDQVQNNYYLYKATYDLNKKDGLQPEEWSTEASAFMAMLPLMLTASKGRVPFVPFGPEVLGLTQATSRHLKKRQK